MLRGNFIKGYLVLQLKRFFGINKCFQIPKQIRITWRFTDIHYPNYPTFLFGYFNIHFIFRIQNPNTRDETGRFSLTQIHGPSANLRQYKVIRIPESKILESGILGFGICNTTQGIRNPINDFGYPKSKYH